MLAAKGNSEAGKLADRLTHIYGRGNVYLELQRHGQREEECRNQALLSLASSINLPVVATNGVQYAIEKDREILDVLTAIRHHTSLDRAGRLLMCNNARELRRAQHMAAIFADIPEAVANTCIVSDRLEFTLDNLGYEFPHYPVPASETMDSFLAKRVEEGVVKRYGSPAKRALLEKARAQVEHELKLIAKLGFAGYFLIVWDLVHYCQRHDILVQGRGSAANSAVCYALEITAVDPVGMELLFERFLNENRGEWPDIDLDLPSGDHREQVIQYVYERYGVLGSAMTANVISYRGRSAAREVGKALGFTEDQLARLSGLVGHWEWRGENDTMARHFEQAGFDARHPRIAHYLDLCMRMQNLPRHLGQHSGGMVICAGMLNRVVPLERASMPGRTVIQWDKEDCADMGLIKVDLLGLGMMAVLQDCIELIPRHYKKEIDLATLPEDDPLVYETLCKADTVGMFQVESRAQMASIPHNAPIRFYDLVVQVAIIRPGPIVGKMMHPYMRRRQGKEEVSYPHPSLEPVLKRTLGVPLFQEQLLRMAMTVANFTGAEAEELRRAVGMRRSMQRMRDLEGRLRAGMTHNGIGPEAQDNIVQGISSFAMYGFPESHAASFALIAYASAYLKVHYLAAFTCGLLNNQPMGFYAPAVLIKDAQRHGLRVRPIDVQRSEWLCTLEAETEVSVSMRIGMNYVKGLRQSSAEALIATRNADGSFASVDQLAARVPATQPQGVGCACSGGGVELRGRGRAPPRCSVAGGAGGAAGWSVAAWSCGCADRRSQSAAAHDRGRARCCRLCGHRRHHRSASDGVAARFARTARLSFCAGVGGGKVANGRSASPGALFAGSVLALRRDLSFFPLEDETGIANVIIAPDVFEQNRLVVTRSRFLSIRGKLQNQDGVVHVKAQEMEPFTLLMVEQLRMRGGCGDEHARTP